MVKVKLLILLIISSLSAHSQELFKRTYGAEGTFNQGLGLCNSHDQGFIICGATGGFGAVNGDGLVIKTDSSGIQIWAKAFGGNLNDVLKSIIKTNDGNYVAAGFSNSNDELTIKGWAIKFDDDGNLIWQKQFGSGDWNYIESLKQTNDNGLVMAGTTLMNNGSSGWLVKFDADGNTVWEKFFNIDGKENFFDVAAYSNGDYIVGGYTESIGNGMKDALMVRFDEFGEVIFSKTFGFEGDDVCLGVDTAANNQMAITGYFTQNDEKKFLIQMYDDVGNSLNDNLIGASTVTGKKIIHRGDNEFVVVSDFQPFSAWHALGWISYGGLYMKCNKDFFGNKDSFGNAGALGSNKSFVMVGTTEAFTPGQSSVFMFNMSDSCQTAANVVVNIENVENTKAKIYPNPSTSDFTVETPNKPEIIEITDASGKTFHVEKPIENNTVISVSSWPDGLFLIKIKMKDQVIYRKLIVQH